MYMYIVENDKQYLPDALSPQEFAGIKCKWLYNGL